jgi:hypothetical protein
MVRCWTMDNRGWRKYNTKESFPLEQQSVHENAYVPYYYLFFTMMVVVGDFKNLSCLCRSYYSTTRRKRSLPRLLLVLMVVVAAVATTRLSSIIIPPCNTCDAYTFIIQSSSSARRSIRIKNNDFPTTHASRTIKKQHPQERRGHYRMFSKRSSSNQNSDSENEEMDLWKQNNTSSPLSSKSSSSSTTTTTPSSSSAAKSSSSEATPTDSPKKENVASILLNRFVSPRIDDPALPLSDVLVAQIIAPTLQVAWLGSTLATAVSPSWLQPIFATSFTTRGALLAPLLIHGAALASCWLLGALAARAYEDEAVRLQVVKNAPPKPVAAARSPSNRDSSRSKNDDSVEYGGYGIVLSRVLQAGAFATGLLILGTQLDLWLEYHGHLVQWGDSPEIDFRLQIAAVEVWQDVVFEAMTLVAWRLGVALQNSNVNSSRY